MVYLRSWLFRAAFILSIAHTLAAPQPAPIAPRRKPRDNRDDGSSGGSGGPATQALSGQLAQTDLGGSSASAAEQLPGLAGSALTLAPGKQPAQDSG